MKKETRRVIISTIVAIFAATLILITFVLPAEYDIDPLGAGEFLGILGLSGGAPGEVFHEINPYNEDSVRFVLQPYESLEYKYELAKGSSLIFNWNASGTLKYEFHGEPEDGPEGFAQSYSSGKSDHDNGTFTAPFTGIHGWFWENRSAGAVTIDLTTTGFYDSTLEFRDGFVNKRSLREQNEGQIDN